MPPLRVNSDRAMSKVLGQHENFLSRIRTGIQSVPHNVWDALYELFNSPELQHLSFSRPTYKVRHRTHKHVEPDMESGAERVNGTGAARKKASTDFEKDLASANEKIALLTSLLEEKERTIQILLNQSVQKNPPVQQKLLFE